jgi:hypothetical protein
VNRSHNDRRVFAPGTKIDIASHAEGGEAKVVLARGSLDTIVRTVKRRWVRCRRMFCGKQGS